MTQYSSLATLVEFTKNKTEQAATKLQSLIGTRADALRQLGALEDYRQDYALRLQAATQTGLSASNYRNFRRFIATLDEAISQQNGAVAQIDANLASGRTHWQDEKRKLNSFEALVSRRAQQEVESVNRSEQRTSDEISANQFRRLGPSY